MKTQMDKMKERTHRFIDLAFETSEVMMEGLSESGKVSVEKSKEYFQRLKKEGIELQNELEESLKNLKGRFTSEREESLKNEIQHLKGRIANLEKRMSKDEEQMHEDELRT